VHFLYRGGIKYRIMKTVSLLSLQFQVSRNTSANIKTSTVLSFEAMVRVMMNVHGLANKLLIVVDYFLLLIVCYI